MIARSLYGVRPAVWAVLALNLSMFFTVSAGGWVVPDGVLIFCLLAAVHTLLPVLLTGTEPPPSPWHAWLLAGLWFGLAGLSKYNAILVALGLIGFIMGSPRHRRRLAHPAPYLGASLAFAILAPVLIWNARHGWISFTFQTSRGVPQAALYPIQLLTMMGGEAALLSPWVAVPIVAAVAAAVTRPRNEADRLLLWLSLPTILVGVLANLIVSTWIFADAPHWRLAGCLGALVSAFWNYAVSCRRRVAAQERKCLARVRRPGPTMDRGSTGVLQRKKTGDTRRTDPNRAT